MSEKTFTNKQEAIDFASNASKGSYCFHSFIQKNKRMAMQIAKNIIVRKKLLSLTIIKLIKNF